MPLNTPYKLAPEQVKTMFHFDVALYRVQADKSLREVSSVSGDQLATMVAGERILARDIAWCLAYGNWPKYQLFSIDGQPHNVQIDNLLPMRTKTWRFRCEKSAGLYVHPLHESGFKTEKECRKAWGKHVAARLQQDYDYIMKQEHEEREARFAAIATKRFEPVIVKRKPRTPRAGQVGIPKAAPSRPKAVPGHAWHYYEKEWLSVPESCHVSDDYRRRCYLVKHQGAVRFEFQPEHQMVFAYDAAGAVIVPNTRKF